MLSIESVGFLKCVLGLNVSINVIPAFCSVQIIRTLEAGSFSAFFFGVSVGSTRENYNFLRVSMA